MKTNGKKRNHLRNLIFERDSYTCVLCENGATDMHHYILRSHGGRDIPENLVSVCRSCHSALHGQTYDVHGRDRSDMEQIICEYLSDYYGGAVFLDMMVDAYSRIPVSMLDEIIYNELERDAIAEYGGG